MRDAGADSTTADPSDSGQGRAGREQQGTPAATGPTKSPVTRRSDRPSAGTGVARGGEVRVWDDLAYAARSLARTPVLSLTLLLTIALGVGSNVAVAGF